MRAPHTPTSRIAAGSAALLTVVQAARLLAGDHDPYVRALLLALVVLLAATTTTLLMDNGVESRLATGLLAMLCGGGIALNATMGLPGQPPGSLGTLGTLTVGLAGAVVLLMALDQRRRADVRDRGSSYAS